MRDFYSIPSHYKVPIRALVRSFFLVLHPILAMNRINGRDIILMDAAVMRDHSMASLACLLEMAV